MAMQNAGRGAKTAGAGEGTVLYANELNGTECHQKRGNGKDALSVNGLTSTQNEFAN